MGDVAQHNKHDCIIILSSIIRREFMQLCVEYICTNVIAQAPLSYVFYYAYCTP